MPTTTRKYRIVRLILALAMLLMVCSAFFLIPAQPVKADAGDNYPSQWKNAAQDTLVDNWGEFNRECTSWASWALHDRNGYEIPFHDLAGGWGADATAKGFSPDKTPAQGSIAWWGYGAAGASRYGHVAWVASVASDGNSIVVEEYNFTTTGAYDTRTITKAGGKWPTGFIHFPGSGTSGTTPTPTPPPTPSPSSPAAVSRTSNSMDVFYNDGYNHIMGYFWNSTNGWSSGYWSDNNIAGQPTVTDRTSNNLDIFYRTTDGKLEYRAWTVANGWGNVVTMVPSGVSGDPWAISRGSNDMQIFFLYNSQQIASINWDINNGWSTAPQILYSSGALTDPVALSRNSNSMDVFFGKNNGNLVHLGWDPTNGWLTSDFSAGSGVDGRPTAIFRNGGNDMSAYYKEKNSGKVAEEFWDWQNGWGWQDWNASLAGSPSTVPGVSNVIDNFYRETGGNIVDRSFGTNGWVTNNIVPAGNATGNPFAVVRGSYIEVLYWNGSALMDWNSTIGGASRIN